MTTTCAITACGRPVADAHVCTGCANRTAAGLRDAADLWPELAVTIARLDRMGDPTPRAGRPAPASPIRPDGDPAADQVTGWPSGLPVNLAASETADVVRNTVTTWARHIADEVGADPPGDPAELMRWLAGRMEWVRHQPWAAEAIDELGEVPRLLRRAVDQPTQRLPMGQCGADTTAGPCQHWVSTWPGATVARCGGCGAVHDVASRRRWLLEAARDRRGTATEVARWLTWLGIPTTPAAVRGLAYRRRIAADAHGRYRLGDVEEIRRA